jgi:hypothetical protein
MAEQDDVHDPPRQQREQPGTTSAPEKIRVMMRR